MAAGFRRILVAIDASPLSLAALDAGIGLASRLGAELDAVFVEDINIVRLVAHPYVHTFSRAVASRQSMDDGLIEKMLELQLVAARRAVEGRAGFVVRRGRVEAELLEAATNADLVCLGWSGRAEPGGRPRLGAVARAVLAGAAPSVLLSRRAGPGPVVVWWQDGAAGLRALALAAVLASPEGTVDMVVAADDALSGVAGLAEAETAAAGLGVAIGRRIVGRAARCLAELPPDAVLVTAGALAPDEVPCSLVVVR